MDRKNGSTSHFRIRMGRKCVTVICQKHFIWTLVREDLENEFDRNYKRVRAEAERTVGADEELRSTTENLEAQSCEAIRHVTGASDGREGQVTGKKSEDERVHANTGKEYTSWKWKTKSILIQSRNARRNSEIKRRNSSFNNELSEMQKLNQSLQQSNDDLRDQKRFCRAGEQEQLEKEIKDVRDQNSKLQIQVNKSSVETVDEAQRKQKEAEKDWNRRSQSPVKKGQG